MLTASQVQHREICEDVKTHIDVGMMTLLTAIETDADATDDEVCCFDKQARDATDNIYRMRTYGGPLQQGTMSATVATSKEHTTIASGIECQTAKVAFTKRRVQYLMTSWIDMTWGKQSKL